MPIISTSFNDIGNAGQVPSIVRIETDDSISTVLTAGYLNVLTHQNLPLSENALALVSTGTGANKAVTAMSMTYSGGDWSLVLMEGYQASGGGGVVLPTVAGAMARFTDTNGTISSGPGDVTTDGSILLTANVIADGSVTAGAIITAEGSIRSGAPDGGFQGSFTAYPTTVSSGYFSMYALDASNGNFSSTLYNNPSIAASKTYLLPNPITNSEVYIAAYDGAVPPTVGNVAVFGANLGLLTDGGPPGGGGITFSNIAGTTQAAAVNTGYIVGSASQTTITLPATAPIGSIVIVKGKGAAGWILTANTGQTIQVGQSATSSGGTITSAANFDSIQVSCITANTTWSVDWVFSSGVTTA